MIKERISARLQAERMRFGQENPNQIVAVDPDLPDARRYLDSNATHFGLIADAARHITKTGLDVTISPVDVAIPDTGYSATMLAAAVSLAMQTNQRIGGGKNSIRTLSTEFIDKRIQMQLDILTSEPTGSAIDSAHRTLLRGISRLAFISGGSHRLAEADLDSRMAEADRQRSKMTPTQLERRAVRSYTDLIAGQGLLFRFLPTDIQKQKLALAEAGGFFIDLWGPDANGADYFYKKLKNQMQMQLYKHKATIADLDDPYRLGIATALYDDKLNVRFTEPAELAFAKMMRHVGRGAYQIILTSTVFSNDAPGSVAAELMDAYKLYLENKGMGDPAVVKAIQDSRNEISEGVNRATEGMLKYIVQAPEVDILRTIRDNARKRTELPTNDKNIAANRAKTMIGNLSADVLSVMNGKSTQPKLPF